MMQREQRLSMLLIVSSMSTLCLLVGFFFVVLSCQSKAAEPVSTAHHLGASASQPSDCTKLHERVISIGCSPVSPIGDWLDGCERKLIAVDASCVGRATSVRDLRACGMSCSGRPAAEGSQ